MKNLKHSITLFWTILFLMLLSSCSQQKSNIENKTFNNLEDVKDKRIGVLMSSVQDEYITKNYPKAEVLRIDLAPDLVVALKTRQADVIVLPEPEAKIVIKNNNDIGVLNRDIYGVDLGMGFREQSLRDQCNAYFEKIRSNGELDEIKRKWLEDFGNADMPHFETFDNSNPIIVGTTAQDMPFSFMQNNINVGFDIELVTRFAASLGRPVQFKVLSFGGLIPALKSKKIDIMASAAMITEERKKQVFFSEPYFHVGSTVLALKENLATPSVPLRDGSDLATARVATMTGTTCEIYISNNYPNAELLLFDDINDAFMALKTGKADYVFTAFTTSLLAARKIPGLVLLPEKYTKDPSAIAFNKKNTELLKQVDDVLRQFKSDGTLNDIVERWIKPDGSDYQCKEIPVVNEGKPIKVGIAANREPMCFISNGKIAGLDAELIERIAHQLGRPVEYMDMKFSALIAAIESEKVDLIISNFTATEERRKRVNFSEDYFINPLVLTIFSDEETTGKPAQKNWFSRVHESFINNLVVEKRYMMILDGLKQTVIITFFAILLGTIIGGIICFLRMCKNKILIGFAKLYINVMRGTPILVLLMIFFYVIFASSGLSASLVAIITFALNMGAYSSEMFRTAIESVDKGQSEAGIAMGFTKIQTFIYVVFPQAIRRVIPVYKGEVISLLKMTSVVGYIAVVDLTKASDIIRSRTFDAFFPLIVVAIIYFLLAWLLGIALDKLNNKISSSK